MNKQSSSYEQGRYLAGINALAVWRSPMALDVLSGDSWFKSRPCHRDTLGQPFFFRPRTGKNYDFNFTSLWLKFGFALSNERWQPSNYGLWAPKKFVNFSKSGYLDFTYWNTFLWEGVRKFHQTLNGVHGTETVKNPCTKVFRGFLQALQPNCGDRTSIRLS